MDRLHPPFLMYKHMGPTGFRFTTGGIKQDHGRQVATGYMIQVVQQYIEQQKGVSVRIKNPQGGILNSMNSMAQKQLLLRAYAWANDHLKH